MSLLKGGRSSEGRSYAAVLEALGGAADLKHKGFVRVSQLREYVERQVSELTGGKQKPTRVLFE